MQLSHLKFVNNFVKQKRDIKCSAPVEMEKSSYSVTSEPLIKFDDDLLWVYIGEVMHISQGLMTHLIFETQRLAGAFV